jgi:hypothetical protein
MLIFLGPIHQNEIFWDAKWTDHLKAGLMDIIRTVQSMLPPPVKRNRSGLKDSVVLNTSPFIHRKVPS